MTAPSELLKRFTEIRAQIPSSVTLIAVSKTQPYEKIRELYEAGHRDFGENYVQELIEKGEKAKADGLSEIRWHFIGHLQTNKVKILIPYVFMIHGVSSRKLGEEIAKRAENKRISVLIEVNVDEQESKSGVQISELRNLVPVLYALPSLDVKGLMCIPDPERPGGAREAFHRIAALAADLWASKGAPELSMGMTNDFVEAIAEGATLVRIGTAIFGERSPREKL